MKEKITRITSSEAEALHRAGRGKTDWDRIDRLTDAEIEAAVAADPDAPPLADRAWFETATLVLPEPKQPISLRVDPDVLDWYRTQGPGYQSRMNAVLRQYAQAHGARLAVRSAHAPRTPRKRSSAA